MNDKTSDESVGPSVDSESQEERILARRLRMQRRQEALKRAQLGDEDEDSKVAEKTQTISQKQMEQSYALLRKLHEDGFEMVTNIRVASDAREIARRIEDEEARRQRKEKLEAEAKAGAERFEEITKKWEVALQKDIPQDLHDMLNQQKTACDAMLDEKNKLITDYQAELKAKDDQFVRDLKKQAEDIDLLIERMESQVKELTKSYQTELMEIEKAFVCERAEMLEVHAKEWEQMLQERRRKEVEYMDIREKRVEDFEQQLQTLRIQDAEEYNQVKIKLETDVQILQQQLQQMKATYQLNQEKLEYNFQVLQKRDEENHITKSQQKRKFTKLHDVLTNLKRKLEKQEKSYRDDNRQLTADYQHQLDQFRDVQRKAKTFMGADAKKFSEIWLMNEEEAKQLARKVLEADRVIHEQQLGLPWSPPSDLEFMNNTGPIVTQKDRAQIDSTKRLAQQVINASNDEQTQQSTDQLSSSSRSRGQLESGRSDAVMEADAGDLPDSDMQVPQPNASLAAMISKFSPDLVKQILELLCDESGFLIESKLQTLLAPLQPCEQMLMKLDAIFSALGIESEEDVQTLSQYFVKFQSQRAQQPDFAVQDQHEDEDGSAAEVVDRNVDGDDGISLSAGGERATVVRHDVDDGETGSQRSKSRGSVNSNRSEGRAEDAKDAGRDPSDQAIADEDSGSLELISANDVLKALRAFVEETNKHRSVEKSQMANQFTIVNLNERDASEDAAYWAKYKQVISKETEKVWDALLMSFEKYYEVLTARGKLIDETEALKQQNGELRLLLHQYVNSKINQELQIPPTSVFQFNRLM